MWCYTRCPICSFLKTEENTIHLEKIRNLLAWGQGFETSYLPMIWHSVAIEFCECLKEE